MNPVLPALGMLAAFGLAVFGITMIRDPGPGGGDLLPDSQAAVLVTKSKNPLLPRVLDRLGNLGLPTARSVLSDRQLAAVDNRLAAAGRPGGYTLDRFLSRKAAFTILTGFLGLVLLAEGNYLLLPILVAVGWFYLDVWLLLAVRKRQAAIEAELPDFLDVLAVTVSAGLDFVIALERVSETVVGPLREELQLTMRQLSLGLGRRAALEGLRQRVQAPMISTFVGAVLQANELGVPLADTMLALADDMRREAAQAARRQAARAAPRVSLIVTMVLMPGALIIIVTAVVLGVLDRSGASNALPH